MSRDILKEATNALRDEAPGGEGGSDATRMRIMGSVRAQRRRRIGLVRASAVLLAAALGGTAWAAATGRLPSFGALLGLDEGERAGSVQAPAGSAPGSGPAETSSGPAAPAETAPAASAPTETAPAATAPVAVAPRATSRSDLPSTPSPVRTPAATASGTATTAPGAAEGTASPSPSTGEPAAPSSADAAADALYQRAHALHFQAHDYAAARSAWEAYLKLAPTGRFAAFAHYNRALCLVRLGRTDEARRALQPFATGAFGGYRRAEAQSLLDVLTSGQP